MAAKSLKAKNQPQVITFVVASAVLLAAVLLGPQAVLVIAQSVSKGNVATLGKFVAVPAVLTLVTGIIGWAVPRSLKETLVFWKVGRYKLPSCRAFTELGPADPRVDMARLAARVGPLPSTPAEQTAVWYRLYRGHGEEASVEDAHAAYLKFREMTHLSLALGIVSVIAGLVLHLRVHEIAVSAGTSVIEYVLTMFAARNASNHLVGNVLAIESSAQDARASSRFVGKFDNVDGTADMHADRSSEG